MEQQAKMQYEYYLAQTEKYSQTVRTVSYTHLDVYKRQGVVGVGDDNKKRGLSVA